MLNGPVVSPTFSTADARRTSPTIVVILFLLVTAWSFPAHATCVADLTLTPNPSAGTITVHYSAHGSCPSGYTLPPNPTQISWSDGVAGGDGAVSTGNSIDGSQDVSISSCDYEGSHTATMSVDCMKPNPDMSPSCVADTGSATANYSVTMVTSVSASIVGSYRDAYNDIISDVLIQTTDVPRDGHLYRHDLPSSTQSGGTYYGFGMSLPSDTYTDHVGVSIPHDRLSPTKFEFLSTLCDKTKAAVVNIADKDCDCKGQVAKPIHTTTGNMEYSETDPLPGIPGVSFTRRYDSITDVMPGWFGKGWTSVFDGQIFASSDPDATVLVVQTPDDKEYVFREYSGGVMEQLWPTGTQKASFEHVSTNYILRAYGSDHKFVFDDSSGLLSNIVNVATGRSIDLTYGTGGRPTAAADSWGNWSMTVTVDAGGAHRITDIAIDGTSTTWTYGYDGGGRLTSVVSGSDTWRTYAYGDALTEVHDAAGNLLESHTYTADADAGSSTDTSGDDVDSVTYRGTGRVTGESITTVTATSGAVTNYYTRSIAGKLRTVQVDGTCTSCGTRNMVKGFDENGYALRTQDARGYITTNTYDSLGRITAESGPYRPSGCDPATDTAHCRLDPDSILAATLVATAESKDTTYTFGDANWFDKPTVITTTSVLGGTPRTDTMVYDATSGAVTSRTVVGWTGATPATETRVTTSPVYDGTETAAFTPGGAFSSGWLSYAQPQGFIKQVDGPRTDVTDVTKWVYYPVHSGVTALWRGRLAATQNAAGQITRYEDYDVFGNAGKMTDANGVVTERTFDIMGRVLTTSTKAVSGCNTTVDPLCATDLVASQTYDPPLGLLAVSTRPAGGVTTYEYDGRARISAMNRGPLTTDLRERIEYTYDSASGKKSMEKTLAWESTAWVEKKREQFHYDDERQLTDITHPDSTLVSYSYDDAGLLDGVADENHGTSNTHYAYDPVNRLSTVTQKLGAGTITTSYAYDLQGNLVSVTDPNGNTTTYVYDDFGQMLSQSSPVTGTTSYSYDLGGNLTSTTDANSATTTRTYDELNRVTGSSSAKSGATTEAVSWTYDDTTSGHYGIGKVASMTDPSGSTSYRYERRGMLAYEAKTISAATYTTTYRYDEDGNRTSITYPSGNVADYTFDYASRPSSVSYDSTTIVSAAGYLPFGPETQLTFANGTTKTMSFDSRYLPTENKLTASATTLADYTYGEDAVGNITSIHDAVSSTYNRDFGYDDLNRLTDANTGAALWGTGSYTYDAMGNMTALSLGTAHTASFTYSGTTPKLTNVTENGISRSVSYDSAGNETSVGSTTTTISPRNLMKESEQSSWIYDGRGVRTSSTPPPFLLTFAPSNVIGRETTTGTVTLASTAPGGGATVTLTSSNTAALTVPSTVTVSAGNTSATFTATTYDVDTTQIVTVTAAYDSASVDAEVGVQTPPWYVTSLVFDPDDVGPDTPNTTGTVTLASPAPAGGARVYLYEWVDAEHSAGIVVPSEGDGALPDYVDVAAGHTTATFAATGQPENLYCGWWWPDCVTSFQIFALLGAEQEGDFAYHSNQDNADSEGYRGSATLLSVTTLPERFEQGESGRGTITLNAPAPKGGVIVSLSASRPGVELPPTVVVQEGAVTASFELATEAEALPGDLTITASQDAIRRTRAITILPKDGHQPRKQNLGNRLNLHQPEAVPLSLGIRGAFFDLRPRTNTITPSQKYYLYTPELSLMAETAPSTSSTPSIAYEYVWFNGKPVAQVDLATSTIHSVFTDHLGTPVAETDATGAIDWRAEYEPFGTVTAYRTGATRHQPLRFPGQEYDAADGSGEREYNIFRWYREDWGRYTQTDPMGITPSLNLFSYVNGNPPRFADPKGLMRVDPSCLDCPCKQRMMQAVSDFNKFFAPGWGDRNPKCRAALVAMGTKFNAPDGKTPITCMAKNTQDMIVKCAKGGDGCGGPPNMLAIDFNVVWMQPGSCSGLCGNPVNTLFHEALHNCGAPDERYAGGSTAGNIADICIGR